MSADSSEPSLPHPPSSTLPLIYILGNSHSGSTLLGFLLTANPNLVNLGELKGRSWLKQRSCSCGHPVETCAFYGDYFPIFNLLKKNVVTTIRSINPLLFFLKKNITLSENDAEELKKFYTSLSHRVSSVIPNAQFIVDTSKSISLLNAWLNILPRDQIKIIYLKRQTKANVSSFVKRGFAFFPSLLSILTNQRLIKHYLRKHQLEFLEVDYDRFYEFYEEEAMHMSTFIGTDLPFANRIPLNHHVIAGNNKTRTAFINKETEIYKDDEWKKVLSGFQKRILRFIS